MAKKSRRARLSPTQRYMPTPGTPAPDEARATVAPPTPALRAGSQMPASLPLVRGAKGQTVSRLGQNPEDYAHIRADLQRIGILAGSILAILLALRIAVFH
jgi:hypothetical protein